MFMPRAGQELFNSCEQLKSMPESIRHDWQIRTSVELALKLDDEAVMMVTKELFQRDIIPIHALELSGPIFLPSKDGVGSHNTELRAFAFDAYDALNSYFGQQQWLNWCILPYHAAGDDTNQIINLGVFAEFFDGTVVE